MMRHNAAKCFCGVHIHYNIITLATYRTIQHVCMYIYIYIQARVPTVASVGVHVISKIVADKKTEAIPICDTRLINEPAYERRH